MKTYTVKDGDTFSRISTLSYGTAEQADLIISANPQASGGLVTGMILTIPVRPIDVPSTPQNLVGSADEVTISIDGKPFRFWTQVSLRFSIDSFWSFSFTSPFDPTIPLHRETFVPLAFQDVQISIGGARALVGTIVDISPGFSVDSATVTVEGYAKAGVLEDSTLPVNVERETDAATLSAIATGIVRPFGLVPTFSPTDSGPPIDRVAIAESGKVSSYLTKLAKQRGFLLSNDVLGQPLFHKENLTGKPVGDLVEGESPLRSVSPRFASREYYSGVSAVTPAFFGFGGEHFTVDNPFLNGVVRPFTFKADDTEGGDNLEAANSKMGRMFANSISYTASVAGWRDPNGELWETNTRVRLTAPKAMVYNTTEFLIREVELSSSDNDLSAELELVLPGSFASKIPEVLPWL